LQSVCGSMFIHYAVSHSENIVVAEWVQEILDGNFSVGMRTDGISIVLVCDYTMDSLSLWLSHGRVWEMLVSAFSPATDFAQYHTTLSRSCSEQESVAKVLIMM